MSTYVLMRIFESAPGRYDLGIRLLTLGGAGRAYDRLVGHVKKEQRVLDIGCGTGALTLRAARNGAHVKGIDVSAQMLEVAGNRAADAGLVERIEFSEMGVAELDAEAPASYDVVMSGLCFSELSEDELAYTLCQAMRILKPGGLLLVADEAGSRNRAARVLHRLLRAPLAVLTYIITQRTTHPVADLSNKVIKAGFSLVSVKSSCLGSFIELVARKPAEAAP